jgi:glycosyltransferase involved in cell wall biosynthesis
VSEKNRNYLQKWVKKSIGSSSNVVTISEFTKERIIDVYGVAAEKILVIPVPPKQKISPDNSILKRLNLNDYLLFIGTLEPRKNIIKLLESYELLPNNIQDKYPLVLVGGKGWKDEEILQKIEEMKQMDLKVIQTGYVSDAEKSALYESSTLVIQLSHYEGFGMPILEAMSYGKPVICSDIPVFREIADDVAVFVDKDNESEISQTISRVILDKILLESMSKKSLDHTKEYPTWRDVAVAISSLF